MEYKKLDNYQLLHYKQIIIGICSDVKKSQYLCVFCGESKLNHICSECSIKFNTWLLNLFYNKNENSKTTYNNCVFGENETNDYLLWCNMHIVIKCLNSFSNKTLDIYIAKNIPTKLNNYGCEYGRNEYFKHLINDTIKRNKKILEMNPFELKSKININGINWQNNFLIVNRELEKLGIHIYGFTDEHNNKFYSKL
jgi:hypothetical protein